jgi:hypothetical protein
MNSKVDYRDSFPILSTRSFTRRAAKKAAEQTHPTRGLVILVARVTSQEHKRIFQLCHYFARTKYG